MIFKINSIDTLMIIYHWNTGNQEVVVAKSLDSKHDNICNSNMLNLLLSNISCWEIPAQSATYNL